MTGPDRRLDRAGDTAQIVLVGAVAMAFIIVGLVVVANTVLYTESVGAAGSLGSADETAEFQGIARDSTASVVYRVNERNDFATDAAGRTALDTAVRDNVTALSDLLATEYGQEYGVFVDVEPDLTNSEYGARIEQDTATFFNNSDAGTPTDPEGDDWTPVASSTTVAEFETSFDVSEMPDLSDTTDATDRFAVTIGGSQNVVVFNDSGNLSIAAGATAIGTLNPSPDCERLAGDRLLVDFQNGSVPGTDCTFDGVDDVGGSVTVEFTNGDAAVGTYSFVVEDATVGQQTKYDDAAANDDPFSAAVYWSVAIDVTYDGPEISYDLLREIPIYGDAVERRPYTGLLQPVDQTQGADTAYEMNFSVARYAPGQVGDSLDQIEIEITNPASQAQGTFDDVDSVDDIQEIGIDTDGDGYIDEPIPDSEIDQVQNQNDGREVEIDFVGSDPSTNNINASDDILITFDNATNPPAGEYDVEVRPSTGSGTGSFNVTA